MGCLGHDYEQRETADVIDRIKVGGKLLARDTGFFHEKQYRPFVEQIRRGQFSTALSAVYLKDAKIWCLRGNRQTADSGSAFEITGELCFGCVEDTADPPQDSNNNDR
jgi:hypothetical protein